MKTMIFLIILPLTILFSITNTSLAQTFHLKEVVLGNRYDPNNKSFVWKAGKYCPYNWSMEVKKADYTGGELYLSASPDTKPDCNRIYKITWSFNKDIRTVKCGEKIIVDITNIPFYKKDCGIFVWEGDLNPSSIQLRASSGIGESDLIMEIRRKDPNPAHRNYIFLHYPGHIIEGEPSAYQASNHLVHLHHARIELIVCERKDFAKDANGGSFSFRIGNRGISFDVVYVYSKKASVLSSRSNTLQPPVIEHNIQNSEGIYWMSIKVPGIIEGYVGKQIQLVIRFVDENGNFLKGYTKDFRYVDGSGNAAAGSGLINVNTNSFDLNSLQIWMPYYSLNLPYTGGKQNYNIRAFAEIFIDGKMILQSQYTPMKVTW